VKFSEVLKQAADSSFVHPEGKKVPVTVHAATFKNSSKGNPMLEVHLKVTGGPNAGKGRPIRTYLVLDNDTTIQQVMNLGIRKQQLEELGKHETEQAGERLAALLVGRKGAADLKQEHYNERLQNKVSWINPAAGATGPKPKAKDETSQEELARDFDETESDPQDDEEDELARVKRELEEAKAKQKAERSEAPDDLPF
jgi:hypothetical protein